MYVTVNFTYRDSVSQKKLNVSQKRLRRSTKKRVSQKNYELQRHTKKKCSVERSVSQKKLLELASHERLTKGIYLNWRLTKEIAVRSVSQKK